MNRQESNYAIPFFSRDFRNMKGKTHSAAGPIDHLTEKDLLEYEWT